jgi:poly(3-hydroxybutyrate) depolymerase
LIVLLHGSGRNGLSLVEKWKDLAAREGIILVGPDSQDNSRWSSPVDGPDFLRDVVENIKTKYTIDPRRVYLFGHSAGAVFALYMSLLESQYFAATAIHAGAIRPNDPAIGQSKRKTPIAIIVGSKDPFFPLADVRGTADDLNKQGFAVELTVMPGHDHWYYDLAPKINAGAWEFLKKHQLNEDPQYEQYRWN